MRQIPVNDNRGRAVNGGQAACGQEWAAYVPHTAKHAGYGAVKDELVAWKGP
jgi:hypothetical protein